MENSSGKKPSSLGDIISVYSNHPSIQKIKSIFNTDTKFDLPKPTASDIKFVQISANLIDCHLSNIIACDISKNKYSEHAKIATVRPIFKKDDRTKIKN